MSEIKIMFFSNGNTIVFRDGSQVPELQESWLLLYVQVIKNLGFEPTEIEFVLPDTSRARIFEIDDGYNWEIV